MNIAIVFIILSIINVTFSTVRTIATVNGGKLVASILSAGYFAFYTVMLIYTVADFPLWQKCLITFGCNLVGVYVVKFIEEKSRKDKLWKIEMTVPVGYTAKLDNLLDNIPHSYNILGKHTLFSFYCRTKQESAFVKEVTQGYDAKYFVAESKIL